MHVTVRSGLGRWVDILYAQEGGVYYRLMHYVMKTDAWESLKHNIRSFLKDIMFQIPLIDKLAKELVN